jgi:adenylate cyclase
MADIFISYARATEPVARQLADHLRSLGFTLWRDDELPAHRPYADVIDERLRAARAVVVMWSAEAVKSQWVRAEAEVAREAGTLVQLSLDGILPPLPFNLIQCADMQGWNGEANSPGLRKVIGSLMELLQAGPEPSPGPLPAASHTRPAAYAGRTVVAVPPGDSASEGLRADIISALSYYLMLVVVPTADPHADYRLDITSRRSQQAIRVSARLIAVATGEPVWSERYDGSDSGMFELEDKVVLGVAASVEATVRRLLLKEAVLTSAASDDVEALYLRGAMQVMRPEKEAKLEAAALLERVLSVKPRHQFALAVAGLAHLNIWMNGYPEGGEADHDLALDYSRRTLALTDSDPVTTGLAAATLAHLGEPLDVSVALIDRVLALHPTFSPAWMWSGQIRLIGGDLERAREHLEVAARLDPRMTSRAILLGTQGAVEMLLERFSEARAMLQEAVHLTGHIVINNLFLAACHHHMGDTDAQRRQLDQAAEIAPPERFRLPLRQPAHRAMFEAGLRRPG